MYLLLQHLHDRVLLVDNLPQRPTVRILLRIQLKLHLLISQIYLLLEIHRINLPCSQRNKLILDITLPPLGQWHLHILFG